jgi:predicted homoserine dehydrogenase-like protein
VGRDNSRPISVGIVGTGYFGSGLLRRLALLDGFAPRVAANRTLERALAAFQRSGIDQHDVVITDDEQVAESAVQAGRYVATTDLLLPSALSGIDVIAEATGDLLVGARVALTALNAGKHVVAANSDVQATIGPMLKVIADRAGVVYTDIDGDEPGLLKGLVDNCGDMGLEVVVAANGKGVLKRHATPQTQAAYAAEYGIQPWLATAAADGTKLNFEMTVVANAIGFVPGKRGMYGPVVDVRRTMEEYHELGLLDGGHYVDYVLGARGVFVIVRSDDPVTQSDFNYLKLGDGPFYLLHRPEVLVHYAAPFSIRRAMKGQATVTPLGAPVAETVAVAKRDLEPGQRLDGVGGFDTYGQIVRADEANRDQLLPIGLAQYTRTRRRLRKDEPIPYCDVVVEDNNLAIELRRKQDEMFAPHDAESVIPFDPAMA